MERGTLGARGLCLGPAGAVVLGGVATVAIAGTWWVTFPDLREVDRFPGTEDPDHPGPLDPAILEELGP